jgi:hypothetical protein
MGLAKLILFVSHMIRSMIFILEKVGFANNIARVILIFLCASNFITLINVHKCIEK